MDESLFKILVIPKYTKFYFLSDFRAYFFPVNYLGGQFYPLLLFPEQFKHFLAGALLADGGEVRADVGAAVADLVAIRALHLRGPED